jgi:PPOX class probable F420-dependent enzyme
MSPRAEALTPEQEKLFLEPNLASFVTLMPDGSPQVSPVWIDHRDGLIWVNTAERRQKHRNALRDPRVSVEVIDPKDGYRWVAVRGKVVEITNEGAEDHIDFLSKKYTGREIYADHNPNRPRVLIKIQPEHVTGWH